MILLAVFLCAPFAHAERTLFWRALEVEARLDGEGELFVSERHTMVFNGDWNGGERVFRVGKASGPFHMSVWREDPSGDLRQLTGAGAGGIGLDQLSFDGTTLRWRARKERSPVFRDTELTYVLRYTLRKVAEQKGDGFEIDHDFAFADRPGVIEKYSLNLKFDEGWKPAPGFTPRIERENLPPGETVIVNIPLAWTGQGQPKFVATLVEQSPVAEGPALPPPHIPVSRPAPFPRLVPFLLFAGLAVGIWRWFVMREQQAGRYDGPPEITPEWLQNNLLIHRADVVGAAWDSETGEAEVAALIATMTMEGKIENIAGPNPRLKLLVPLEDLSQYESDFVKRLFVTGDEIDPATLREHYAKTGFDPAWTIRSPLRSAAIKLVGSSGSGASFGFGCLGLLIASLGLLIVGIQWRDHRMLFLAFVASVAFLASFGIAMRYRTDPDRKWARAIPVPLLLLAGVMSPLAMTLTTLIIGLTLTLLLLACAFHPARQRGSGLELKNLRNFRAAREYLRRLLEQGQAGLDERLVPYLLAFGLGTELDRWYVASPRPEPEPARNPIREQKKVVVSPPGTSFRLAPVRQWLPEPAGKGGGFGGAGASAGWASSISSFAAAVPDPAPKAGSSRSSSSSRSSGSSSSSSRSSSSSSSSSRSSGGSRSGGGGGGGW